MASFDFGTRVRAVLLAGALSACVDTVSAPSPGSQAVSVSVDPAAASLAVAASMQFTARVTGGTSGAVTWSVEPAGCGTVTPGGLYTAPATAGACRVRATSSEDTRQSAAAIVTVTDGTGPPLIPIDPTFQARLVPQAGVTGVQRVNFALPIPAGLLHEPTRIRLAPPGGSELASARRALATWPDGSLRSVQLQVEVDVTATTALDVEVDAPTASGALTLVDVAGTLAAADGTAGPRVWVLLPSGWLASSQVAGPIVPAAVIAGTPLDAWSSLCDYAVFDADAFLAVADTAGSWLYDRPTALYLGYAITGDLGPLQSAYREAAIYRAGLTGTDENTRISVPGAASDLKYHYAQGMAIHYLLTGDDRFREGAENVAVRAHALWSDPGYAGGADFWTERHAGFALLAYEWAAAVSDDRAATFAAWSDQAVAAYLPLQDVATSAWEVDARCFAHSAEAHGEAFGYVGCSPWMSAILADGLEAHARRVGGAGAAAARSGLVRLGRMLARHGRDLDGRPYYWMGAGVDAAEIDPYEEHWGESAYVVALAWHWSGRTDAELRTAALSLVDGLGRLGEAGQLRSFNWQCRSAVMTPFYLRE